jgi:hypothetical protein
MMVRDGKAPVSAEEEIDELLELDILEPNEHQTPRFQGKYSYHTHLSENPERPNSPNILPMSQSCWCVGFFVSVNLSVFREKLGENVGLMWGLSELP